MALAIANGRFRLVLLVSDCAVQGNLGRNENVEEVEITMLVRESRWRCAAQPLSAT